MRTPPIASLVRWWRDIRAALDLPSALVGFAAFFLLAILLFGVVGGRRAPEPAIQPIAFNHRIHVQDLELACTDCHESYETETFSGLPSADTCAMCHDDAESDNAEERKLVALLAEGKPLEWEPLFRQPAHVFYSHRRHVVVAGMECAECHGNFEESEKPPASVEILTMDACLACHQRHQRRHAGTDCSDCHR